MKKVIALLLVLVMTMTMVACSQENTQTDPTDSKATEATGGNNATEGNNDPTNATDGGNEDEVQSTYISALELYAEVCYKDSTVDMLSKMAPDAYWSFFEDSYGMSKEDFLNDGITWVQEKSNYYKTTYGQNLTVTIEVVSEAVVSADELEAVKQSLQQIKGVDPTTVTAAYALGVNFKIDGTASTEEYQELKAMQIDGKWYLGGWFIEEGYGYTWFEVENLFEAG